MVECFERPLLWIQETSRKSPEPPALLCSEVQGLLTGPRWPSHEKSPPTPWPHASALSVTVHLTPDRSLKASARARGAAQRSGTCLGCTRHWFHPSTVRKKPVLATESEVRGALVMHPDEHLKFCNDSNSKLTSALHFEQLCNCLCLSFLVYMVEKSGAAFLLFSGLVKTVRKSQVIWEILKEKYEDPHSHKPHNPTCAFIMGFQKEGTRTAFQ